VRYLFASLTSPGSLTCLHSTALSVVSPRMGSQGWPFANIDSFPGATSDTLNQANHIKDLYLKVQPDYGAKLVSSVVLMLCTVNN